MLHLRSGPYQVLMNSVNFGREVQSLTSLGRELEVLGRNILRLFFSYALQIILKSPKLIGQKSLSYDGHLLKDKRLKFSFLRGPAFRVLLPGISPPKKT